MKTPAQSSASSPIAEIERLLTHKFFVRTVKFRPDFDLFRQLHLYSTDFLELLNYLELRFSVEFEDEEINQVRTAHQLSDLVLQHLRMAERSA